MKREIIFGEYLVIRLLPQRSGDLEKFRVIEIDIKDTRAPFLRFDHSFRDANYTFFNGNRELIDITKLKKILVDMDTWTIL